MTSKAEDAPKLKARFKTTSRASARSPLVEYRQGQYIFHTGDLGTEMFVVHEGKVEVMDEGVPSESTVAVLERGDFFGEMAVLESMPRSASVRALTDVKLVRIDGTTFTQLLRNEPEIAVRIMRKLSRRLRIAEAVRRDESGPVPVVAPEQMSDAASAPVLVHRDSGTRFVLPPTDAVLVGRRDPITGIQPAVDLSAVDPERSCSRQHGKILRDGDRFLVVEDIGTTNGTYLNGRKLETGVLEELNSGDELRFGLVTLDFTI